MSKNSIFNFTGSLHLRKHKYVLNYHKYFDCDAGQLIPVAFEECVPGDIVKLGHETLIRMQPLIKPIFGKLTYHTYSFFCPTRLLFGEYKQDSEGNHYWDPDYKKFELFLSQGRDGRDHSVSLPMWTPTGETVRNDAYYEWTVEGQSYSSGDVADNGVGSLWDYFGLPLNVVPKVYVKDPESGASIEHDAVLAFPKMVYNLVYGEYFRDQNLMDFPDPMSSIVRNKCWKRDLFTSALPWQQRGVAPALPLSGTLPVSFVNNAGDGAFLNHSSYKWGSIFPVSGDSTKLGFDIKGTGVLDADVTAGSQMHSVSGSVDLSNAGTFTIAELRASFQLQKWLERSARGGTRMKEILLAHFGEAPSDEVLSRPAFIGHTSTPILISEVLQTSETTSESAQGNLSGHGVSASRGYIGKYHAKEFGYIITLGCIVPDTSYSQGINRQFTKHSRWDFFWPETMFLSEEAVRQMEIFAGDDAAENASVFGYQSRFYELRSRQNIFCGNFRSDLKFWHMGREFGDAPLLNESFVKMVPTKRIFASIEEPGFLVDHFNVHTWYRPIPKNIEPGLIDHI